MMKKKEQDRFVITYTQGGFSTETAILVDRETGVNYIFFQSSRAGGLTPLLAPDGTPVITDISKLEN